MNLCSNQPFKTIHDRRLSYLIGLQSFYDDQGYTTKVNGRDNILEVYPKGCDIPKTKEEEIIEKWID